MISGHGHRVDGVRMPDMPFEPGTGQAVLRAWEPEERIYDPYLTVRSEQLASGKGWLVAVYILDYLSGAMYLFSRYKSRTGQPYKSRAAAESRAGQIGSTLSSPFSSKRCSLRSAPKPADYVTRNRLIEQSKLTAYMLRWS